MNRKLDQYGLPARVLVRIDEDSMGNITIACVSKRWAKRVAESNVYDGHGDFFAQETYVTDSRYDWPNLLPRTAFFGRGKDKQFNDGARFYLDSWTFRHMVGGQSD